MVPKLEAHASNIEASSHMLPVQISMHQVNAGWQSPQQSSTVNWHVIILAPEGFPHLSLEIGWLTRFWLYSSFYHLRFRRINLGVKVRGKYHLPSLQERGTSFLTTMFTVGERNFFFDYHVTQALFRTFTHCDRSMFCPSMVHKCVMSIDGPRTVQERR